MPTRTTNGNHPIAIIKVNPRFTCRKNINDGLVYWRMSLRLPNGEEYGAQVVQARACVEVGRGGRAAAAELLRMARRSLRIKTELFVVSAQGRTPTWIKPGEPGHAPRFTFIRPEGIPLEEARALKAAANISCGGTLHICRI
jgi:hypothetical protein